MDAIYLERCQKLAGTVKDAALMPLRNTRQLKTYLKLSAFCAMILREY